MKRYHHLSEQDVADAENIKQRLKGADYVLIKLFEAWQEKKLLEQALPPVSDIETTRKEEPR